jgi:hypothetical protein
MIFVIRENSGHLLVERNDRLINLGLACYGTSEEVFKALYKHALEKPADAPDERYKRGLRIGCLSNRSVPAAHFVFDFPRELIGPEEIHRVLAAGDDAEAEPWRDGCKNMDRIANGNGKVIEAKADPAG